MVQINFDTGVIKGENVIQIERRLGDLENLFLNENLYSAMDMDKVVYRVEIHQTEKEGKVGGLFWALHLYFPGK